jgi:hypothetical protein
MPDPPKRSAEPEWLTSDASKYSFLISQEIHGERQMRQERWFDAPGVCRVMHIPGLVSS